MSILNASAGNSASQNSASSFYNNQSWSNSYTNGAGATASSNLQAQMANSASLTSWADAARFNAEQAQIQREWQERMANTVYQRSVKDMKAAGINPILASGFGLGSASVGSGATASMSAPEIFMGNSFADQQSASGSTGHGESESSGSSWSHSESGLATFLESMGTWVNGLIGAMNAGKTINFSLEGLDKLLKYDDEGGIIQSKKSNGKSNKGKDYFNFDSAINTIKSITNYITMKGSGGMITPNEIKD